MMTEKKERIIRQTMVCILVFAGYILLLSILKAMGFIVFVNRSGILRHMVESLGSSIYFFAGNLALFMLASLLLYQHLNTQCPEYQNIKFWDSVANISLSLFFGIGVIYTAVGMMRAFQLALGNIDQHMAASLGPWGILQKLVKGGLLMALGTTIVGGALGYTLRLIKFMLLGKSLIRFDIRNRERELDRVIDKSLDRMAARYGDTERRIQECTAHCNDLSTGVQEMVTLLQHMNKRELYPESLHTKEEING